VTIKSRDLSIWSDFRSRQMDTRVLAERCNDNTKPRINATTTTTTTTTTLSV